MLPGIGNAAARPIDLTNRKRHPTSNGTIDRSTFAASVRSQGALRNPGLWGRTPSAFGNLDAIVKAIALALAGYLGVFLCHTLSAALAHFGSPLKTRRAVASHVIIERQADLLAVQPVLDPDDQGRSTLLTFGSAFREHARRTPASVLTVAPLQRSKFSPSGAVPAAAGIGLDHERLKWSSRKAAYRASIRSTLSEYLRIQQHLSLLSEQWTVNHSCDGLDNAVIVPRRDCHDTINLSEVCARWLHTVCIGK